MREGKWDIYISPYLDEWSHTQILLFIKMKYLNTIFSNEDEVTSQCKCLG